MSDALDYITDGVASLAGANSSDSSDHEQTTTNKRAKPSLASQKCRKVKRKVKKSEEKSEENVSLLNRVNITVSEEM